MPKALVKYEPDHDEKKYEARKKFYMSIGYLVEKELVSMQKKVVSL